jgi:hypothetical protein
MTTLNVALCRSCEAVVRKPGTLRPGVRGGADEVLYKGESSEKIQSVVEQYVGGLRTRGYYSD